ncbi:SAP domain-containing protein [Isosphaeraceae bacterium EP7]
MSPLNYWHQNLNPACERRETDALKWGHAVHCRLLEAERFSGAYAAKLSKDDYPGVLVTDDDLKACLVENGLPTTGKRKQERIDRIRASGIDALIWDELVEAHAGETAGKVLVTAQEMRHLDRIAEVVQGSAHARKSLNSGLAEVSFFVRDPSTGVMLKARMDYVRHTHTVDLKTFSNTRGKSTERAIFDAMFYEGYYAQAVFYHYVREIARLKLGASKIQVHGDYTNEWWSGFVTKADHYFEFLFIESDEPFDMRPIVLQREEYPNAEPNAYWTDGELRISALIRRYAEYVEQFGNEPWRESHEPHVLLDTDMPQLIYNGGAWDQ